jgi:alpha-N-arabinofuranosidase
VPVITRRLAPALAAGCAALLFAITGSARAADGPTASIVVDAAHPGDTISPAVFGSDFLAPFGGMGSFEPSAGGFAASFLDQLHGSVYTGSLRFPGGITGESYQWQRAIGPQAGRGDNAVGPANGPSPSTVGPDEFGQLLDRTGATGVMTVNFGTGSADQAAELVQYMTGAPGSSAWADRRVADGHRAPYHVPYWEVGNEEYSTDYWRTGTPVTVGGPTTGCPTVATCEYIYGGTTHFSDQKVVLAADRRATAAASTGAAAQRLQVAYPPVAPGSAATIDVGGQSWTQVASLASAGPTDDDYTLDSASGQIGFGDGVHGAIPPAGQTITASYDSGPHDGFLRFYRAMKRADPAIHVCATDTSADFITAMGRTLPYDCLQEHPYVSAGDASPSEPIDQYEAQVMAAPTTEASAVQTLQSEVAQGAGRHVPLVLSEYGQLINATPDPLVAPYYLNSLDEALINASQLAAWIRLGVPVADRQLLTAQLPGPSAVTSGLPGAAPFAVTGAITTPGPQTVVQPTGADLQLMRRSPAPAG